MKKIKEDFENLSKALESSNAEDAKKAFAQLKQDAPELVRDSDSPVSAQMKALSKAVEAGDISGAKKALTEIKQAAENAGTPPGAKGGKPGGARPAGPPPAAASGAAARESSRAVKTYDKEDANQDGKVTEQEKVTYQTTHPDLTKPKETVETAGIKDLRQLAAREPAAAPDAVAADA